MRVQDSYWAPEVDQYGDDTVRERDASFSILRVLNRVDEQGRVPRIEPADGVFARQGPTECYAEIGDLSSPPLPTEEVAKQWVFERTVQAFDESVTASFRHPRLGVLEVPYDASRGDVAYKVGPGVLVVHANQVGHLAKPGEDLALISGVDRWLQYSPGKIQPLTDAELEVAFHGSDRDSWKQALSGEAWSTGQQAGRTEDADAENGWNLSPTDALADDVWAVPYSPDGRRWDVRPIQVQQGERVLQERTSFPGFKYAVAHDSDRVTRYGVTGTTKTLESTGAAEDYLELAAENKTGEILQREPFPKAQPGRWRLNTRFKSHQDVVFDVAPGDRVFVVDGNSRRAVQVRATDGVVLLHDSRPGASRVLESAVEVGEAVDSDQQRGHGRYAREADLGWVAVPPPHLGTLTVTPDSATTPETGLQEQSAVGRDTDRARSQMDQTTPAGPVMEPESAPDSSGITAVAEPSEDDGLGSVMPEPTRTPEAPAQDLGGESYLWDSNSQATDDPFRALSADRRIRNNIAAIRLVRELDEQGRDAEAWEQHEVLARWTSWGAVSAVFDDQPTGAFARFQDELQGLLSQDEWDAARRTTINAHYTDPAYVRAVWDGLTVAGFTGGHVLEPGCGSGIFLGTAPEGAQMTGIELDPMTAKVASYLHPDARVRAESFAHSPFADDTFDAAVGNVPFADTHVLDERHNPGRKHVMHNHFILKSLALTRPGGVVAVLTSRYTLDSTNRSAREQMHEVADLIGAVRLPTGAHRRVAGTEAVTDLVVLRKRLPGEAPDEGTWLGVEPLELVTDEGPVSIPVNRMWVQHPERVLGQMGIGHGMHGAQTLTVTRVDGQGSIAEQLSTVLDEQAATAVAAGRGWAPRPDGVPVVDPDRVVEPVARTTNTARFEGHLDWDGQRWTSVVSGVAEEVTLPAAQHRELLALVGLRDATVTLLEAESATSEDTEQIQGMRRELNDRYDAYVNRFGPINRVRLSERSRRKDGAPLLDDEGNPVVSVSRLYPPAIRTFRDDPHSPVVRALETYDEVTRTASKMAIFERRVIAPRTPRTSADSPQDALAIVMDAHGQVKLGEVASLLDVPEEQARAQLGTLVFNDPGQDGRLVPAAEYLSGNVRRKLAEAEAALESDPALHVNVAELEKVLPADLGPDEITVRLGAVWVPSSDVQHFVRDTLDDSHVKVALLGGADWTVSDGNKHSESATSTWGTKRLDALELVERMMRQKRIVVTDPIDADDPSGPRTVNPVETEAAQAKAEQWQEAFAEWAWSDPERAERLAGIYNEQFNSVVLRSYDESGQALTLPGLTADVNPHPHQRAAVARMVAEPSVGLYHAVGAGKTAEMVMGAMELRRLGLVNKPAIVVPNHMLEQFTREWLQWYPQANVLAASTEDLRGDRRRRFVARAATGDWDGVVLTQGAFGKISVSQAAERSYREESLDALRAKLKKANELGESRSVKQIEKAVQRAEEALDARMEKVTRDPGLTWEQTGIDYLIVDELHMYKNLTVNSNIQSVDREGSLRAMDLDMKVQILREKAGPRGKVMTGATATPIANAMAEAWVMQKYLRPDLLAEAGVDEFDAWAATFGQVVSAVEIAPQGGGNYRTVERFAQFQNVPELLRMWHVSADVKTPEDLGLPIPQIAARQDGSRVPDAVVVPATEAHLAFMSDLGDRADQVKSRLVDPTVDNMLKISGDGRKAALDLRLLNQEHGSDLLLDVTKLEVAADRIHGIWAQHRDDEFRLAPDDPADERVHPNRGALQIVFCDLGTPKDDRWDAYQQLRDNLVERGMDRSRVRFVHEADSDVKKGLLFGQCRNGEVDVLVGSTEKMGVGTNIQARAVALHHLDCPWRPADVEQREGRILRQGNQYPEVQINRYVTERSFDAYSWQTVERKAKFIAQVMHGSVTERNTEDIATDAALGYSELKAVTSNDPLLLERAESEQTVAKLERLERAHQRNQTQRHHSVSSHRERITELESQVPKVEAAIADRTDTGGKAFRATVDGQPATTERTTAARALGERLRPLVERVSPETPTLRADRVLHLGGHALDATVQRGFGSSDTMVTLVVRGLEGARARIPAENVLSGEGYGAITKAENLLTGLDSMRERMLTQIDTHRSELAEAQAGIGQPFAKAEELGQARATLARIDQQMSGTDTETAAPRVFPAGPADVEQGDYCQMPDCDRNNLDYGAQMPFHVVHGQEQEKPFPPKQWSAACDEHLEPVADAVAAAINAVGQPWQVATVTYAGQGKAQRDIVRTGEGALPETQHTEVPEGLTQDQVATNRDGMEQVRQTLDRVSQLRAQQNATPAPSTEHRRDDYQRPAQPPGPSLR